MQRGSAAVVVLAVVLGVAALAVAYVPRTVTSGELDLGAGQVERWELRAAPGILSPRAWIDVGGEDVELAGFGGPPAHLADTEVAVVSTPTTDVTLIVGPTPWRTSSVRHDTQERRPGEARVHRVAWRRVHVAVLPGEHHVTELTAIGRRGSVQEVVLPSE